MSALPPPDAKARHVREMFDRIAGRYDRMNRILTASMDQRWRRDLVDRLGVDDRDRVLDLACGTGDFAEIVRLRTRYVYALDFAPGMLAQAHRRGLHGVSFVLGDAQRLPFADASLTVAVSGFALRNFISLPVVFGELARVLAPGGRIGLLEVDQPTNPVLRAGHALYFGRAVPALGGWLSGDAAAYRYLPQSASYLPPARELAAMLATAGFHRVRKRVHAGGAAQSIVAERR